ncbi:phage head closure protein [Candidatus Pacearchaeota archaeon]|jgi:SPP1 family predicted phage head-tail adaptor|nr:phage head closure protein [Candidatus Pacearchaeota archaeon]
MNIGKLRHRITLQSPTATLNAIHETVDTWTDVDTVWAAIEPNTGTWYYAAKQANSNVKGRVRIRYRSDIEATWRIKFGDRILNIISILTPDERKTEIVILYSEDLD